jgi:deoxyribose-phosphate aldolase
MELSSFLDLTLLNPTASKADIKSLVDSAKENKVFAVCVNSNMVMAAKFFSKDTDIKIVSVVGFPTGAHTISSKLAELESAILDGADEIDVVPDLSNIRLEDWDAYYDEIVLLKQRTLSVGPAPLKVIIESAMWDDNRIRKAAALASAAGADFVKTSTGYAKEGGATLAAVQLILESIQGKTKVKASGGIRTKADAMRYLEFGVSRIGASSVSILSDSESTNSSNSSDY